VGGGDGVRGGGVGWEDALGRGVYGCVKHRCGIVSRGTSEPRKRCGEVALGGPVGGRRGAQPCQIGKTSWEYRGGWMVALQGCDGVGEGGGGGHMWAGLGGGGGGG